MCQGIHADFYIKINFSNSIYLYRNLSYPQVFIYEIFFSQYYHRVEISLQLHSTVIYTNLYLWMTEIKKNSIQSHKLTLYTHVTKIFCKGKYSFWRSCVIYQTELKKNNYQQLILSCTTIYIILKLLFFSIYETRNTKMWLFIVRFFNIFLSNFLDRKHIV